MCVDVRGGKVRFAWHDDCRIRVEGLRFDRVVQDWFEDVFQVVLALVVAFVCRYWLQG